MKQAYYLEPEKVGVKPYYLLKQALEDVDKVAVGKIALRDREHMATLRPYQKGLAVNSLHWPDEIRSMEDLNLPEEDVKIDKREMSMAKMLIENLTEAFDPARFHDEYREALLSVARAKAEGHEITVAEAPAPKVMDLMAALKASVEASKRGEGGGAEAEDGAGSGRGRRPKVVAGGRRAKAAESAAEKPRRKVARAS
jgi:DNA end-binding protein Ku